MFNLILSQSPWGCLYISSIFLFFLTQFEYFIFIFLSFLWIFSFIFILFYFRLVFSSKISFSILYYFADILRFIFTKTAYYFTTLCIVIIATKCFSYVYYFRIDTCWLSWNLRMDYGSWVFIFWGLHYCVFDISDILWRFGVVLIAPNSIDLKKIIVGGN